jgi:hypothetical protein
MLKKTKIIIISILLLIAIICSIVFGILYQKKLNENNKNIDIIKINQHLKKMNLSIINYPNKNLLANEFDNIIDIYLPDFINYKTELKQLYIKLFNKLSRPNQIPITNINDQLDNFSSIWIFNILLSYLYQYINLNSIYENNINIIILITFFMHLNNTKQIFISHHNNKYYISYNELKSINNSTVVLDDMRKFRESDNGIITIDTIIKSYPNNDTDIDQNINTMLQFDNLLKFIKSS